MLFVTPWGIINHLFFWGKSYLADKKAFSLYFVYFLLSWFSEFIYNFLGFNANSRYINPIEFINTNNVRIINTASIFIGQLKVRLLL